MKKSPTVIAEIVRIGNSHGVRIPKALREQAGLSGKVTLTATQGGLVIRARRSPREGWGELIAREHAREPDEKLWPEESGTEFDRTEWTW